MERSKGTNTIHCVPQSGRHFSQRHSGGGLHHDGDGDGLAGSPGCGQGGATLRRPQPGFPAAAAGVRGHAGVSGELAGTGRNTERRKAKNTL